MKEILDKYNFFVFDSNSLDKIEEKLYGFIYQSKNFDFANDIGKCEYPEGTFIKITINSDKINIYQDILGSFGIYIYREDKYFAISNSLLLLSEFLSKDRALTFDIEYASVFLAIPLTINTYDETIYKEIKLLPRDYYVEIDKKLKVIEFKRLDIINDFSIDLDSEQAINYLDSWHEKWIEIIKYLDKENHYISVDLSGGFDSRLVFMLVLNSGIDINNIRINSIEDKLHTHQDDFKIATKIALDNNIKLNKELDLKNIKISLEDTLSISFYSKIFQHKQMYFNTSVYRDKYFSFTGSGGECLRNYWGGLDKESYILSIKRIANDMSPDLIKNIDFFYARLFFKIIKRFPQCAANEDLFMAYLYRETRLRSHFGTANVESLCVNKIKLSPLSDNRLFKINYLKYKRNISKGVLPAIILYRYNKKLLGYKFDSNKFIDNEALVIAKNISDNYKSTTANYNKIYSFIFNIPEIRVNKYDEVNNPTQFLKTVFQSSYVFGIFTSCFNKNIYNYIINDLKMRKFHPLTNLFSLIALTIAIFLSERRFNYKNFYSFFNHYHDFIPTYLFDINNNDTHSLNKNLEKYLTIRIDAKVSSNSMSHISNIISSDEFINYYSPSWFIDENDVGTVILSKKGEIDLSFVCSNEGSLKIFIRGIDYRLQGKRYNIYILLEELYIANRILVDAKSPIVISHDHPFIFKKNVVDGEIINMQLKWSPI